MPDVEEEVAIVEPVAESKAAPEPAPEHEAWSEPEPPAKPARPEFADPLAHALADLAIAQAELARVQSRNVEVERALEIARAERDEARKALAAKA